MLDFWRFCPVVDSVGRCQSHLWPACPFNILTLFILILFYVCWFYYLLLDLNKFDLIWHTVALFNGHFPGEPGLAGVYWSKGWWRWWWQLDYWSYKSCKAPVKSSPPTNQHLELFYKPDDLPVTKPRQCQSTEEKFDLIWQCSFSAFLDVSLLGSWQGCAKTTRSIFIKFRESWQARGSRRKPLEFGGNLAPVTLGWRLRLWSYFWYHAPLGIFLPGV